MGGQRPGGKPTPHFPIHCDAICPETPHSVEKERLLHKAGQSSPGRAQTFGGWSQAFSSVSLVLLATRCRDSLRDLAGSPGVRKGVPEQEVAKPAWSHTEIMCVLLNERNSLVSWFFVPGVPSSL